MCTLIMMKLLYNQTVFVRMPYSVDAKRARIFMHFVPVHNANGDSKEA